jgi:hypothetical protein
MAKGRRLNTLFIWIGAGAIWADSVHGFDALQKGVGGVSHCFTAAQFTLAATATN